MARDFDPKSAFPLLANEASISPPGANGLIMLPYFSGERTPIHDVYAKGRTIWFKFDAQPGRHVPCIN